LIQPLGHEQTTAYGYIRDISLFSECYVLKSISSALPPALSSSFSVNTSQQCDSWSVAGRIHKGVNKAAASTCLEMIEQKTMNGGNIGSWIVWCVWTITGTSRPSPYCLNVTAPEKVLGQSGNLAP